MITGVFAGNSTKANATTLWDENSEGKITKGAFTYHYLITKNKEKCWVYRIDINSKKGSTGVLTFPSRIKNIPITKLGALDPEEVADEGLVSEAEETIFGTYVEYFHDYAQNTKEIDGIKKIYLPSSLEEINEVCFAGMRGIEEILIPKNVRQINRLIFYKCEKLKEVTLPAAMEKFNTKAFMSCKSLKKITLAKQNKKYRCSNGMVRSKGGKVLYWVAPGVKGTVKIPEETTKIQENAMSGCRAKKVLIGKNVTSIASHALDIDTLKELKLSKKNKHYGYDNWCIYSKVSGRLVVGLAKKGKLTISNKVTTLKSKASIAGGYVSTLVIPKSVKKLETDWLDMFSGMPTKYYFKGMTPPKAPAMKEGEVQLPVFAKYYVPKKAFAVYRKWAEKNHVLEDSVFIGV